MKSSRKRILCAVDHEETVIYGRITYEMGREPDDAIAVIYEEGFEEHPLRISEWDVYEITDCPEGGAE